MKRALLIILSVLLLVGVFLTSYYRDAHQDSIQDEPRPPASPGPGTAEQPIRDDSGRSERVISPDRLRDVTDTSDDGAADSVIGTGSEGRAVPVGTPVPPDTRAAAGDDLPTGDSASLQIPASAIGARSERAPTDELNPGSELTDEDVLGPDLPFGHAPEIEGIESIDMPPEGLDPKISVTPPEDPVQGDPGIPPEGVPP